MNITPLNKRTIESLKKIRDEVDSKGYKTAMKLLRNHIVIKMTSASQARDEKLFYTLVGMTMALQYLKTLKPTINSLIEAKEAKALDKK